jgi:uncharacterized protein YbjT (DUF2867 family)
MIIPEACFRLSVYTRVQVKCKQEKHMKILLTGCSGFIGGNIRQMLEDRGHSITCADRHHGVDFNRMTKVSDWLPWIRNADAVVNSVGIIVETGNNRFETLHHRAPAALFRAAAQSAISRVVQISALGADENAFTPYQLSKKAADDSLRELGIPGFILRPSLVIGKGSTSLALFQRLAGLPLLMLADGRRQLIQPIHIGDLLDTVYKALSTDTSQCHTLDLAGPEPMSFAQWLTLLRRHQGKRPPHILPLPYSLVLGMSHLGRHVLPLMHPDNLRMMQKGNTADTSALLQFLGRPLRPAEDAL